MTAFTVRSGRPACAAILILAGLATFVQAQGVDPGPPGESPPVADAPRGGMIRDGFETRDNAWQQEQPDAAIEIFMHERTNRAAHEGQQSEGFEFRAGVGGGLYYSYAVPPIPVTDDLVASLYVRSSRSGLQMLARVVLPNDIDPDTRRPSFVLVPSTTYEAPDRWQKIELSDLLPSIERQARVLRASSRRKVALDGAYIDRIVANIYGGEGQTEVYLDELSIGPVPPEVVAAFNNRKPGRAPVLADDDDPVTSPPRPDRPRARTLDDRPRAPTTPTDPNLPTATERIKFDRNRLLKDGYPWFPTMMRAPDVDPSLARQLGADLLVVPGDADDEYLKAAITDGLFLVPELGEEPDPSPDPMLARSRPIDPDEVVAAAADFPRKEHVFAWSLGERLGEDRVIADRKKELTAVRQAITALRRAKPGGVGYTTATATGMLPEYARIPENLDLIGIPAMTWATARGPLEPKKYLEQRRLLTTRGNADTILWSEVDVTAPKIYQRMIWGLDRPPEGGVPVVQPEQIRMAVYAALAAGCRGLSFRADGELGQGPGRMAAIEIALLNEEIDIVESILADPDRSIRELDVLPADPPPPQPLSLFQLNIGGLNKPPTFKEFPPFGTIRGAAISTKDRSGTLVMVNDFSIYAMYQPGQMSGNKLKVRIPASNDSLAYQICPGGVKPLDSIRTPGGHFVTLEDFGVTATILMTTNVNLKDNIERAINAVRPQAVVLAIEQAELQRTWVANIDYQLRRDGHDQKDWADLIAKADALIASSRDALERNDYLTAWEEARRVGRPLRVLMFYHFLAAYDAARDALKNERLPCGPTLYEGDKIAKPQIIAPIVIPALASFNTLPQAWLFLDWVKHGRLGENVMPGGNFSFENVEALLDAGWTKEEYKTDDLVTRVAINTGGPDNIKAVKGKGTNLGMSVQPRPGLKLDEVVPFADHPIVAVRSPSVPVRAKEIYRISVMAHSSNKIPGGAGGVIVRDSIGGERFQFRTTDALGAGTFFKVVYYRQVPADGELSVLLGLASVTGYAIFDDLKVEPIVEQVDDQLVLNAEAAAAAEARKRKPTPSATPTTDPKDAAAGATPNRTATRVQPMPVRQ